jgi:hypothetical protein
MGYSLCSGLLKAYEIAIAHLPANARRIESKYVGIT